MMIVGDVLRAWIEDPRAREATMERVAATGRAFRALPELVALEAALAAADGGSPRDVLGCVRAWVETPGTLDACLAGLVRAARDDPFFRPPVRAVSTELHAGLVLLSRPDLSLFLATLPPDALAAKRTFGSGPTSISFDGHRSLYHFVKSGGATLSFWEVADCDDEFTAATAGACRRIGTRRIANGETVELDGRRQSFVIEHACSDMVYLQAQTPLGAAPLMREHDSATGRFVGASSTDDVGSRTGLMLSLLREMNREDAAPLFVHALAQGDFHARWHAMREFLALDAEAALPHLERMAEADPHPEVRDAARQTLAAIHADEDEIMEPQPCPA